MAGGPGIEAAPSNASVGGTDFVHLGLADLVVPTKNVTIVLQQEKTDSNNRVSAAFGVGPTGFATTQCGAHVPYSDGVVYWDFGGNASSNRVTASGLTVTGKNTWIFRAGDLGMQFWQNGIRRANSTTAVSRTLFNSTQALTLFAGAGPSGSDMVKVYAFLIYNRNLTEQEIALLSQDPMLPFYLRQAEPKSPVVAPPVDFNGILGVTRAELGKYFVLGYGGTLLDDEGAELPEEEVDHDLNITDDATYIAEYNVSVEHELEFEDLAASPVTFEEEVEQSITFVQEGEGSAVAELEDEIAFEHQVLETLFIGDVHHLSHDLGLTDTAEGDNADVEEVEHVLGFEQTVETLGPIYVSVTTFINLDDDHTDDFGVPWEPIEVEHTLEFVQRAGIARFATASSTLAFEHETYRSYAVESVLELVDDMEYGKGPDEQEHDLGLEHEVLLNAVWVRTVAHAGILADAMTYLVDDPCNRKLYTPFEGGSASMPEPRLQFRSQFTLETLSGPHTILVLRNPETDDRDRLGFNRVNRETRGGELNVFSDPVWAKVNTLLFTIVANKREKIDALQQFLYDTLGQEIKLSDWTGTQWRGVVTTPEESATEDQDGYWTFSFEFEGEAYEGQAPEGRMILNQTASAVVE